MISTTEDSKRYEDASAFITKMITDVCLRAKIHKDSGRDDAIDVETPHCVALNLYLLTDILDSIIKFDATSNIMKLEGDEFTDVRGVIYNCIAAITQKLTNILYNEIKMTPNVDSVFEQLINSLSQATKNSKDHMNLRSVVQKCLYGIDGNTLDLICTLNESLKEANRNVMVDFAREEYHDITGNWTLRARILSLIHDIMLKIESANAMLPQAATAQGSERSAKIIKLILSSPDNGNFAAVRPYLDDSSAGLRFADILGVSTHKNGNELLCNRLDNELGLLQDLGMTTLAKENFCVTASSREYLSLCEENIKMLRECISGKNVSAQPWEIVDELLTQVNPELNVLAVTLFLVGAYNSYTKDSVLDMTLEGLCMHYSKTIDGPICLLILGMSRMYHSPNCYATNPAGDDFNESGYHDKRGFAAFLTYSLIAYAVKTRDHIALIYLGRFLMVNLLNCDYIRGGDGKERFLALFELVAKFNDAGDLAYSTVGYSHFLRCIGFIDVLRFSIVDTSGQSDKKVSALECRVESVKKLLEWFLNFLSTTVPTDLGKTCFVYTSQSPGFRLREDHLNLYLGLHFGKKETGTSTLDDGSRSIENLLIRNLEYTTAAYVGLESHDATGSNSETYGRAVVLGIQTDEVNILPVPCVEDVGQLEDSDVRVYLEESKIDVPETPFFNIELRDEAISKEQSVNGLMALFINAEGRFPARSDSYVFWLMTGTNLVLGLIPEPVRYGAVLTLSLIYTFMDANFKITPHGNNMKITTYPPNPHRNQKLLDFVTTLTLSYEFKLEKSLYLVVAYLLMVLRDWSGLLRTLLVATRDDIGSPAAKHIRRLEMYQRTLSNATDYIDTDLNTPTPRFLMFANANVMKATSKITLYTRSTFNLNHGVGIMINGLFFRPSPRHMTPYKYSGLKKDHSKYLRELNRHIETPTPTSDKLKVLGDKPLSSFIKSPITEVCTLPTTSSTNKIEESPSRHPTAQIFKSAANTVFLLMRCSECTASLKRVEQKNHQKVSRKISDIILSKLTDKSEVKANQKHLFKVILPYIIKHTTKYLSLTLLQLLLEANYHAAAVKKSA